MEARASACPPVAEQLATLRALLRTDLFERCLAERFPHSKARAGRPPARAGAAPAAAHRRRARVPLRA